MSVTKKGNPEIVTGVMYIIPITKKDIHKYFPGVKVVKPGTIELPVKMRYVEIVYRNCDLLLLHK